MYVILSLSHRVMIDREMHIYFCFDHVKLLLIIIYYFNGTDNPKPRQKLEGKKCLVQTVTQLLLLRHLKSLLCTIIQKPPCYFP